MAFVDDKEICETCRNIDFDDLLQNPQQEYMGTWAQPSPYIKPYDMRYSESCHLCCLMFQDISAEDKQRRFELRSYSLKNNYRWAAKTDVYDRDSVLLMIGLRIPPFDPYDPFDNIYNPSEPYKRPVFCNRASVSPQGSHRPQHVQED